MCYYFVLQAAHAIMPKHKERSLLKKL